MTTVVVVPDGTELGGNVVVSGATVVGATVDDDGGVDTPVGAAGGAVPVGGPPVAVGLAGGDPVDVVREGTAAE